MLPIRLTFVSRPSALSDIPKSLPASFGRRFALNSKPRGFPTWKAKMPASGATMHLQLKMRSNDMAAVDMQAIEEVLIPLFFGKNLELKICS